MTDPVVPEVSAVARPFWEATAEGRLLVQRCTDCGLAVYPPRTNCPDCFGPLDWRAAEGTGTVYTYTVVHSPTHPSFESRVPLVVAVVELDEGARLVTNLVGVEPEAVDVGDEVTVVFDHVDDGLALPKFELLASD